MDKLRDELADEIAEAISDSLDMDWQPSWAVPAILEIIQRERMAAAEKVREHVAWALETERLSYGEGDEDQCLGVCQAQDIVADLDLSTIIGGESDD